jgi:predicted RNA-binding Zn-ribbon protein involved in translation (DUF1610 family)
MNEPTCKHENADWRGDVGFWCPDCEQWLAWDCETCGGDGLVYEDDWKGDWINYGPDLIPCPDCGGSGEQRADGFEWSALDAGQPDEAQSGNVAE